VTDFYFRPVCIFRNRTFQARGAEPPPRTKRRLQAPTPYAQCWRRRKNAVSSRGSGRLRTAADQIGLAGGGTAVRLQSRGRLRPWLTPPAGASGNRAAVLTVSGQPREETCVFPASALCGVGSALWSRRFEYAAAGSAGD